jgi:hypothetical protein
MNSIIKMKLVRATANYHLYKVGANEDRDSFGEVYVAKRDFPQPPPTDVEVIVEESTTAALWRAAERMKREGS